MIKKMSYLIAVAALGSSAVLTAPAAPAAATVPAATAPDCWDGHYCLYSEDDFKGYRKGIEARVGSCVQNKEIYWPSGYIRRPASMYSNAGEATQLEMFANDNCTGAPVELLRNHRGAPQRADRVKSFRIAPRCDLNHVCLYENKDFSGKRWQINPEYTNICYSFGKDAEGHGVYNATGYPATFYRVCSLFPRPVEPYTYGVYENPANLAKLG
ncbi:peptidase inhibitor family I36 protein [Streptomyces olivaceus]|uniref:peptidase inhibitor family I36 protein n=1 Tax=Streptomyces olivaceus TaxID=47716 RepID=UPI0036E1B5DC